MVYDIFPTRFQGEKLPSPEAIARGRRRGELQYFMRVYDPRPGRGIWIATLTGTDGETYILPPLDRARVREIRGGILISGREVIARGTGMKNIKSDDYPQTWWCLPVARPVSGFEDDDARKDTPADARRKARERELGSTLETQRIAEALTRRPTRRMTYDPRTASGINHGYF